MNSKPIRLAVLLQDLEFGGTQRYAAQLLARIDRQRFQPELWVLRSGSGMDPAARATGVPISRLSQSSRVGPVALTRLMVKLLGRPPDILYTLTVVPNIWGRVFGRAARVPVIFSGYRSLLPNQHEGLLWRLSDRVVCNAEMLRDVMIERFAVNPNRIAVIPNAVDAEFFRPDPERRSSVPVVCSIGRLVEEKDPMTVAEAFRRTAERVPEARFEIVGDGPFRRRLEQFLEEHNLASRVRLIPGTDDVRSRLWNASVFALGSKSEASPNVIIEAMAVGLPVVATSVGGVPELVEDGRTGLLTPPRDPRRLSDALVELLANETLRARMGAAARERALTRHSFAVTVPKLEKLMLEVFEERNRTERCTEMKR